MFKIFLFTLFLHTSVSAETLDDISKIGYVLSENEVDSFVKEPEVEGLPGVHLQSLIPKESLDSTQTCPEEEEKQKPKDVRYEVIMVVEGSSEKSESEKLTSQLKYLTDDQLKQDFNNRSPALTSEEILQTSDEVWRKYQKGPIDPHSGFGRELMIESIVRASQNTHLSEQDLAKGIASIIRENTSSENERYDFLSALSSRLYRNYNIARNPGFNNSENNPENQPLPEGDMSLMDILKGAANFNSFDGGVCNDISEAVAIIGTELFPEKDVLLINSGSHFGVMIADDKESRIIDSSKQYRQKNELSLFSDAGATNLRISKVVEGKTQEIAVVDTQMGQLMESVFQTGKPLLKTSADIQSVVTQFTRTQDFANNQTGTSTLGVGFGQLATSDVYVVVAKYEHTSENWQSYVGVGGSAQQFRSQPDTKYQVHLRMGAKRNLLHYVNSRTEMNISSGLQAEGMYALSQERTGPVSSYDASAQLDWVNSMNFKHEAGNGVLLKSNMEVRHTLGPKDVGAFAGGLSSVESKDILGTVKNMSFHLNQVNLNLDAEKELSPRTSLRTGVNYQGSNIGQNVGALAGLNIKIPEGAQLLVFAGYDQKLRGYKTKHNHLSNSEGARAGIMYQSKNGTRIFGGVREISSDQKPVYEMKVSVPLGGKKR
jgi:hypothetical protein